MTIEAVIEQPFTTKEEQAATKLKAEIDTLLGSIAALERSLSQDWVKLGHYLHEVRERKFWILFGYKSFGSYIMEIGEKVGKGRSRLYQSVGIVEKLPGVTDSELTEIGISKASELCKLTAAGKSVPQELIAKAKRPETTIDQVREDVFNTLHSTPEAKGRYYDLGGFYCSAEEKAEIDLGFQAALRVDPAVPQELPEWAQRKEALTRMVREFLATYPESWKGLV
jgi:hypothetical protein